MNTNTHTYIHTKRACAKNTPCASLYFWVQLETYKLSKFILKQKTSREGEDSVFHPRILGGITESWRSSSNPSSTSGILILYTRKRGNVSLDCGCHIIMHYSAAAQIKEIGKTHQGRQRCIFFPCTCGKASGKGRRVQMQKHLLPKPIWKISLHK